MHLEEAISGIYDYLKDTIPNAVTVFNSSITDGVLLTNPNKILYENLPDPTVNTCITLNTQNINFQGAKAGVEFVDIAGSLSIDVKENSYGKNMIVLLRWIDLISDLFFEDPKLGGTVNIAVLGNVSKVADDNFGYCDMTFVATIELMEGD